MYDLLCNPCVSKNCESFAALDFCGGFCVLGRNRTLSVCGDVSNLRGKHPMVFCLGGVVWMRGILSQCMESQKSD